MPHENGETDINRRPIDPITGRTVEAGLKGEWLEGRLSASLSVFQSKRRNVAVEAGKLDNDDTYYRAANTKAHGWEAEISGSPAEGWDISAGVQSHLTREENGNRPTANTTRATASNSSPPTACPNPLDPRRRRALAKQDLCGQIQ